MIRKCSCQRFGCDICPVVHLFELDLGYCPVSAPLCLLQVGIQSNDRQDSAACGDQLSAAICCSSMKNNHIGIGTGLGKPSYGFFCCIGIRVST